MILKNLYYLKLNILQHITTTMASEDIIVAELLDALSSMCELDRETINALKPGLQSVIQKHISAFAAPTAAKAKGTRKTGTKRATTKSDTIPHKNGYHFFVAAKMGEVKNAGVGAKERMKTIGEMWKALNEEGKKIYQDKAKTYNEAVDAEMKNPDWAVRRETIVANANAAAGVSKKVEAKVEAKEAKEDEEGEEEEVEVKPEVKSTPAPAAAPAPALVTTTAPVVLPVPTKTVPMRRTKKTS